jgi:hypothetical protein
LLIPIVLPQADVVTEPIKKKGVFAQIFNTVLKYWVWFLVIVIAIVIIVTIVLLIKSLKKRIDPFKQEFMKTKKLCKFHANPTTKEVWAVADGRLKYMGKYIGECVTQDGYFNIMLWKFKKWFLFWFPIKLDFFDLAKETFVIKVNLNKLYKEKIIDPLTKEEKIVEHKLATDLVFKDGDKIVVKCLGIEPVNYFFYPVLRDAQGNIADGSLEIFSREKQPALINTLYSISEDFANVSRELININPRVRYITKTGDTESNKQA